MIPDLSGIMITRRIKGIIGLEMWKYWCKAIGAKAFDEDKKADKVAIIRTVWIILHIITCIAIITNTWRHF